VAALTDAISTLAAQKGPIAEAAGPAPNYEIYAVKYSGPATHKLARWLFGEGWDENVQINFYVWAIKGKDGFIIVDTGASTTLGGKRLRGYVNPVDALARIGVNGSNVSKVIISHMHFDHVGGMEMFPMAFPKATFYLQKKEYDFWIKHPVAKRFPLTRDEVAFKAIADLEETDRLSLIYGDQEIAPGIELLLCPGHSIALQSVAVNTAKGTAIVASDAIHLTRAFGEDRPTTIIFNMLDYLESYDKLKAKATSVDLIFPGHDLNLSTNYPKVAEEVTRLV
jgi:glyoxylase-like metal-dependent hydrolase (beta-lactamase superfamily II)